MSIYNITSTDLEYANELNETKSYTYLIGWKSLNRYYYGVRYAKQAKPIDLFRTYFTSSKHVKLFLECNGPPDVIQIRKIFNDKYKALDWEHKVLTKMKVVRADMWLNRTTNKGFDPKTCAQKWSETSRKKASDSHTGKKRSLDVGRKISEKLKGRDAYWLKGKKQLKHSAAMKGAGNPRAIKIEHEGIIYETLKSMSLATGMSYYIINKIINNNNNNKENVAWPDST
jgi:hypothetical protein